VTLKLFLENVIQVYISSISETVHQNWS